MFLVAGVIAIALVCGFLVGVPLLRDTRQYFVRFTESTAGVDEGTAVRYLGVKAGRVRKMTTDYDEILVELELDPSLKVTESTQARIASAGLVGTYFVELYGTVRGSRELPEGAVIKTDPSTMKTLVDMGTKTVQHLQLVLSNLEKWTSPENEARFAQALTDTAAAVASVNQTLGSIKPDAEQMVKSYAAAAEELRALIAENREPLQDFTTELAKAAAELNRFLASGRLDQVTTEAAKTLEGIRLDFNRSSEALTRLIEEAKIDQRLGEITASLDRAEKSFSKMSLTMQSELTSVTRGELAPALNRFREAMSTLEELTRVLRDDPSLLIFSKPRPEIDIPRPGSR